MRLIYVNDIRVFRAIGVTWRLAISPLNQGLLTVDSDDPGWTNVCAEVSLEDGLNELVAYTSLADSLFHYVSLSDPFMKDRRGFRRCQFIDAVRVELPALFGP